MKYAKLITVIVPSYKLFQALQKKKKAGKSPFFSIIKTQLNGLQHCAICSCLVHTSFPAI